MRAALPLSVLPDNIPEELRQGCRHVGWKLEVRDGKPTKPPYCIATGKHAAVNDPLTWTYFEQAYAAHKLGEYHGVGYVLTADDDLVGFDLDHVRDPETGMVTRAATDLAYWVNSYTEVSPSGTGLRILVRGVLPAGARRRGPLEVYSSDRYLTITGHVLGGMSSHIEHRDLNPIHRKCFPDLTKPGGAAAVPIRPVVGDDHDLLERARGARNGARFAAAYDAGALGDWGGDASAADLALAGQLLYWCAGDVARADSLFRRSALMRPKWDERHSSDGSTYGQLTLARAVR